MHTGTCSRTSLCSPTAGYTPIQVPTHTYPGRALLQALQYTQELTLGYSVTALQLAVHTYTRKPTLRVSWCSSAAGYRVSWYSSILG